MESMTAEAVIEGFQAGVARLKAEGVKVIAGTLPTSLNSTREVYGSLDTDARRRTVNTFIRTSPIFDGVVDFDAATIDEATGVLKEMYQPDSTLGGPPDRLHPNRAGYLAMGEAVDLKYFAPLSSE
jgi:lysophospholipase L1-like esterase